MRSKTPTWLSVAPTVDVKVGEAQPDTKPQPRHAGYVPTHRRRFHPFGDRPPLPADQPDTEKAPKAGSKARKLLGTRRVSGADTFSDDRHTSAVVRASLLVFAVFIVLVWLLALKSPSSSASTASVRVDTKATVFATQALGTMSAARSVVVTAANPRRSVTIQSVALVGTDASDFLLDATSCDNDTLAGSRTCTIAVRFSPSAPGTREASLVIHNSGSTATVAVSLSGQGVIPPLTAKPSAVDFGPVGLGGTSASQTVSVTNTSGHSFVVQTVSLVGDNAQDFSMAQGAPGCIGLTLAPNSTCALSVAFAPTEVGNRSASLMAIYNDPSSPLYLPISGVGADLSLQVDAAGQNFSEHHSFGNQLVGTTGVPVAIDLIAPAAAGVHLVSVNLSGPDATEFVIESDNCVGTTLAPQVGCTVWVAFAPNAQGPTLGALSVVRSNEATAVSVVQFDGFGIVPKVRVTNLAPPRVRTPVTTRTVPPAGGSNTKITTPPRTPPDRSTTTNPTTTAPPVSDSTPTTLPPAGSGGGGTPPDGTTTTVPAPSG
jgi:hypothetical protein